MFILCSHKSMQRRQKYHHWCHHGEWLLQNFGNKTQNVQIFTCKYLKLTYTLWFIFNIFIHKWEKLNLQFSLVLMIHNAIHALNFDISKIKRVLDKRIFTKIVVLIYSRNDPFVNFLFLSVQKFAHWLYLRMQICAKISSSSSTIKRLER